jgi:tetratricopeptide (TPR) repeat protein
VDFFGSHFKKSTKPDSRAEQALQNIDKAIEYKSTSAVQFYNRAGFYNKLGKQREAIADLKQAIELDPNYKEAKERLKEMHKQQSIVYF